MLIISDGLPRGLGYFEVDQRMSGLVTPESGTPHFEADTYTCTHCEAVVVLNPLRKRERYKCVKCNHHLCDDCAAEAHETGICETFKQKVEKYFEDLHRQLATQR